MKKLFILIFLLSSAMAGIQSIKMVSVVEPPSVRETLVLGVKNDYSTIVRGASFALPLNVEVIKAEDKYGALPYTLVTTDKTIILYNFTVPLQPDEERILSYEFLTPENLEKTDSGYTYRLYLVPPGNLPVEFMLELPPGYRLDEESVSPKATITLANGKTHINWNINSVSGETVNFNASFSEASVQPLPEYNSLWLVGLVVAVLIALAFLVSRFIIKPVKYVQEKITPKMEMFDRRIIDIVSGKPGINQNDLVKVLNMSKVTLSKRVTSLVEQGILRKERRGKRNYLYLARL